MSISNDSVTSNKWLHAIQLCIKRQNGQYIYTVAHKVGIFLFYPNLWNYFKNNLKIIDLDNSIHSQILLNNNLPMCV